MFGYISADPARLREEDFRRYRGCYCGLCRALKAQCGGACRLTLSYDMTFLILLLSSLYEPEEAQGVSRCAVHPVKAHEWWENEVTRYGAYMNAALAYENCLDDWRDERRLTSFLQARLFSRAAREAAGRYPRPCEAMTRQLSRITALERERAGVDTLAGAFGELMAELFVLREDRWAPLLRRFGMALGRFIYVMDAVCDLERDRRRKQFNPLLALDAPPEHFRAHLTMLIADAAEAFERLPLVQDEALLRNILYQGVWLRYDRQFAPAKENDT